MRIEEAIKLHNARKKIKNYKNGKKENYNLINKAKIGRLIWTDQNGKRPLVSMSNLINGKNKTIKLKWIYIICKNCGVDPNFLLGKPSKYDKEFRYLCEKKGFK